MAACPSHRIIATTSEVRVKAAALAPPPASCVTSASSEVRDLWTQLAEVPGAASLQARLGKQVYVHFVSRNP